MQAWTEAPRARGAGDAGAADAERWQVRGAADARGGLGAWADVLTETHVAFETTSTDRTPDVFMGTVTRRRVADLMLVDCACAPFLGRNGRELVDMSSGAFVGLQFVRHGMERVREGADSSMLRPGDLKLWPGWEPVHIEVLEPFVKRTLIIPLDRVVAVCPRVSSANVIPPLAEGGLSRILVRYLDAIAMELPGLDDQSAVAAADAALELLRAALEPNVPSDRTARRLALRSEVRRYIRGHLQDPQLCPESIARAHALSVRALHAVFEDSEESVASLIRRERLNRCKKDLERSASGAVTEIAFRWGFSNAAHFSRAFKREFGVAPSDVRRAAA